MGSAGLQLERCSGARTSSRRRVAAALAGLLYVSLFVQSGAHAFLVEHEVCEAHGDLVHAREGHGHRLATDAALALSATEAAQHDHCGAVHVASVVAPQAAPPAASAAATWKEAPTTLVLDDGLASTRSVELLRLAPKTSPPA